MLALLIIDTSKLNIFVANRLTQNIELTNENAWKHIRSQDNPADIISRNISPNHLGNSKIGWYGSVFSVERT